MYPALVLTTTYHNYDLIALSKTTQWHSPLVASAALRLAVGMILAVLGGGGRGGGSPEDLDLALELSGESDPLLRLRRRRLNLLYSEYIT